MLFLLKRTWRGGLLGLALLVPVALGLRHFHDDVSPVAASWQALGLGVVVFVLVLASDVILHGLLLLVFGAAYRRRHRLLAGCFRDQSLPAVFAGALLAGVGEELLFRGSTNSVPALILLALLFGLFHHISRPLWPFTVWAAYQGLLFVAALHVTGALFVTVVAHFLHDLCGFLLFRTLNRAAPPP